MTKIEEVVYLSDVEYSQTTKSNNTLYIVNQKGILKIYCNDLPVSCIEHLSNSSELPQGPDFIPGIFYIINNSVVEYSYQSPDDSQGEYFKLFDSSLESLDLIDEKVILKSKDYSGREFQLLSLTVDNLFAPASVDQQIREKMEEVYNPQPLWREWFKAAWSEEGYCGDYLLDYNMKDGIFTSEGYCGEFE